jgi:hypothetical protein
VPVTDVPAPPLPLALDALVVPDVPLPCVDDVAPVPCAADAPPTPVAPLALVLVEAARVPHATISPRAAQT